MRISCYGNTDPGLVRDHNEDAFYISEIEPLYVVADGMGGHNCGEVASRIAVETIAEFYNETAGQGASATPASRGSAPRASRSASTACWAATS